MSIRVRQLSKCFRLYARPKDRLKEWLSLGKRSFHTPFWALRDVDLDIPRGTSMGIIGPNGAGKSTLLKIITGTLFPTSGQVEVDGRVAALLELGTGFHAEFSGRLNIYLNGKMLGLSDDEIDARFDDIVRFSELGAFIEQPIRTYSSGMVMRLGFAIASCVDPQILIVDEALSVGDAYFSQKCVRRIREFRENGVTILFVSHDPAAVLTLCDNALLLERGRIQSQGAPEEVLDFYNARNAQRAGSGGVQIIVNDSRRAETLGAQRSGNFRAIITDVRLCTDEGQPAEIFQSGQPVRLGVRFIALEEIDNPTIGILIRNRLGIEVFGLNSMGLGSRLGHLQPGEACETEFDFDLNLGPDDYSVTVAVHLDETHLVSNFDWIDKAWRFRVIPSSDYQFYGLARLEPVIDTNHHPAADIDLDSLLRPLFADPPPSLDLSDASSRFFLDGWSPRDAEDQGSPRAMERHGRFVFRPNGARLSIEWAEPPSGARLEWLGGCAESQPGKPGEFDLPPHLLCRLNLFAIETSQPASVRAIRSVGPAENEK